MNDAGAIAALVTVQLFRLARARNGICRMLSPAPQSADLLF